MNKLYSEWFPTKEELTKFVNHHQIDSEEIVAIVATTSPVGYTLFYWRYVA